LPSAFECTWSAPGRWVFCSLPRVYMRSKMIKHNKDLFEFIDDPVALLDKLHIY
jgi:hypothetical protein